MRLDIAARAYLGTPFRHQGRNPALGIDCVGLLVCAANDCGHSTEADATDYGRDPVNGVLQARLLAAFGPALPSAAMQPGDVAAIAFAGAVRHVGVIGEHTDGLSLIHTNSAVGRVTEAQIDARWQRRIVAIYRPVA